MMSDILRPIYRLALLIERLAFWLGWRARRNYRWAPVASAVMRLSSRLKSIYFGS